ncbi:carboxypeptidase-like regulatory domain-containing protein, partial [bacterium]|nr:carboxypeptidase-like regulatory domain-containing protein [bacterium]
MKRTAFQAACISLFLGLSQALMAQGVLRGVVIDSLSSRPLAGANVYLVGTALGSATDLDGLYRIDQVPPGNYTLRISYIGYKARQMPVLVLPGQTAVQNATLVFDVLEGQAVIVTGQAVGQAAAINQQISSNTIVNVISEEKIQELPDVNAAEAMGRLPGVSIQRSGGEANKVVLRGLSDKYSTVTVDGVRLAPTDADARGVDLSTISQGSLAGIELYKALTPDKDADAIAGSVNLVTRAAPAERLLRTDIRGSYNDLNQSYDQYDIGLKYGERFLKSLLGVQVTGNLERRDRSKEDYDLDYNQEKGLPVGSDYEITDFALNYTDEIRSRQGLSLLLDYYTPDGGSIRFKNIYNRTKRDYIEYGRNYPTTG